MVLDASAVVQLLLGLPGWDLVARRLRYLDASAHAPHLVLVEAAQAIRRHERSGGVTASFGAAAMSDLADLDLTLHEHDWLLPRVWELRSNLTAYDAAYVALAESLDAPLLTFDARLARATGHHAVIELLPRT